MAEEQGIIASLLESIGDALKRDELEAPNNDLSTRIIGDRKVVVRGAKRDKNGKLVGGTIIGRAGTPEDNSTSISTKIGRPQGNLRKLNNGGSIKLRNFKGTF
jgi:lipoate-protein ligase A